MARQVILVRSGQSDLIKSHVSGYTKKDGTFVKEHEDGRSQKPGLVSKIASRLMPGKKLKVDEFNRRVTQHLSAAGVHESEFEPPKPKYMSDADSVAQEKQKHMYRLARKHRDKIQDKDVHATIDDWFSTPDFDAKAAHDRVYGTVQDKKEGR